LRAEASLSMCVPELSIVVLPLQYNQTARRVPVSLREAMNTLLDDLRYAIRLLIQSPADIARWLNRRRTRAWSFLRIMLIS